MPRSDHLRLLFSAAVILFFLLHSLMYFSSRLDDAFIFGRYAHNLVTYGDLVWNPGGPRVEGFSSWLWLAVYVVGEMLPVESLLIAKYVGLAVGCLLVFSFGRALRLSGVNEPRLLGAVLCLASYPPLAFFSSSGMDHVAWALVSWWYLTWLSSAPMITVRHAIPAGLGLLVRPEGFLLLVPLIALVALGKRRSGRIRVVGAALGVMLPILATRFALFHQLLPNAAAAKHLGGHLGLRLLEGSLYLAPSAGWLLLPLGVALAFATPRLEIPSWWEESLAARRLLLASLAYLAASVLFILVAGGDDSSAFGPSRLLVPLAAPSLFVLFVLLDRISASRTWILVISILFVFWQSLNGKTYFQIATDATNLASIDDLTSRMARGFLSTPVHPLTSYLLRLTPPGEFVAIPWAGLVPYQTRLPTIDLLGLNDPKIAHTPVKDRAISSIRYGSDLVIAQAPFFICDNFRLDAPLSEVAEMSDEELRSLGAFKSGQRDLLRHPRLQHLYTIASEAPINGTCLRRRGSASPGTG
ncbi:MAG TPA: hypothetical protein VNB06_08290 [Thermoanaerobaculia bacterium]|nr:hypothetical protein [Thermoanaerobaculia bacterium]